MSKIAEKKALEAYQKDKLTAVEAVNQMKRFGYIQGYDQAMQNFLEKAEEYLRNEFVDMWLRYIRGHSMDDEIKMFKNYMQNEK